MFYEVKVKSALQRDVGRGIIRLDTEIAKKMNISAGQFLQIRGRRVTSGVYWPSYPEDNGTGIIRIDNITRKNAGSSIDEVVEIRTIEAKPAIKISLAPSGPVALQGQGAEEYFKKLLTNRVLTRGDYIEVHIMGRRFIMIITHVSPSSDAVIMNPQTTVIVSTKPVKDIQREDLEKIRYEDIGGLNDEIQKVREMIELPMKHPELFKRLGISPPRGVLLHGPPGTGKTLLARAVAHETEANFISVSGPEFMSKFYGESEQKIRDIFNDAKQNAPSIIFIDEIDSIAPKRGEVTGEVERRVVAQLLSNMDGLSDRGDVVVIGATNRVNALDPALRRGGRFDREIEIGIPDRAGREEILLVHTRGVPLNEDVDLTKIAGLTHGFVGADLAQLVKEAAMTTLRRHLPDLNLEEGDIDTEALQKIIISVQDFMDALIGIQPSALREVFVEVPDIKWDDIGGLDKEKREIQNSVELPIKYPEFYKHIGVKQPTGILLYGPPGTGKTMLAKAVANETQANFISIKGPELLNKWVGESEKGVREVFRKARQASPCIIFFDEIDSIAPIRGKSFDSGVTERMISQLLTEMDGLEEMKGVLVIAATNRPDILDTALLRPGRFDKLIGIGLPSEEARIEILKIHTKEIALKEDVDLLSIAKDTEGFTGAELTAIVQEAGQIGIDQFLTSNDQSAFLQEEIYKNYKINNEHFRLAFEKVKNSRKTRKGPYASDMKDQLQSEIDKFSFG